MKSITFALLTLLAGFAATTARADDGRTSFRFGVTYGPTYSSPVYVPAPVVVAPGSDYRSTPDRYRWEDVTVKTWIPARWVASRDRWGRPIRILEEGRYAFHTERVWVDHNDGYRRNDNAGRYDYRDDHRGWNR